MNSLGTTIRKIREEKRFSQDYVAKKIGISQNSYCKIESGETNITIERLFRIAEILETSVHDILNKNEYQKVKIKNNQAVIGHVNNLTLSNIEKEIFENRISAIEHEILLLKKMLQK